MRNILFFFGFFLVSSGVFATVNTELVDEEKVSDTKFSYQTFSTCSEFEWAMKKILPKASTQMYNSYARWAVMMEDAVVAPLASLEKSTASSVVDSSNVAHSETNTQVFGVDEADTVKTDGKYLYTYQEWGEQAIIVIDAKTLARVKTIKIPSNYSGVSFYLTKTNLVITATKYTSYNARWYGWYNNDQTSIIALYDIRNPAKASLVRTIQVEWSLSDSRITDTGIMTAVVSTSYAMPPIYAPYFDGSKKGTPAYEYSSKTLIPRILDTRLAKGKYTTETRTLTDCKNMGFVLPDLKTLENYSLTPTLTSIIRFDTTTLGWIINSQVVLSDAWQIHLSKNSIYLTSNMWTPIAPTAKCAPNTRCASPMYWNPGVPSTLIHRFAFNGLQSQYVYTANVLGTPLNQYSMDEDSDTNFRIVTTESADERSTRVSVLNSRWKIVGTLSGIAPGENFQSSRFIGDRLYLVTFEQIDPLFVIDLKNKQSPKILGELKIPGYSTYLHPYDANRLIGVGYDTKTNQWGGTQNAGIKIDLYNVKDVKNPKQEQSLVIGDVGSSSDILWNPRLFTYYKEKNLLLMPGTFMMSANDPIDTYRSQSAFQWVVGVSILPGGITEKFRVSHIAPPNLDAEWKKSCEPYMGKSSSSSCRKLLDGSDYCESSNYYVPPYCFAGSTVDTYFANQIWNYSTDFINRALYIGDEFYTIGTSQIRRWKFADTKSALATLKFKTTSRSGIMPLIFDAVTK